MNSYYGAGAGDEHEISMIYPDQVSQTFAFKHQEYTIGADKLVKETENSYDDKGTKTSIVKDITYDPDYLLPVSESITNSNGDTIKAEKKYPFNASDGGLPDMVSNNILSDVIRTNKYKNNTLLESTILNYKAFPSTSIYNTYRPESVLQITNGVSDLRIYNMQYDNRGNPQSMIKDENTKIVYLWSYNYQYCIAKIEGLDYVDVVNALGGTDYITTLSAEGNPTKDEIEQIRSKIDGSGKISLVTTYSYIPLVGMVTVTDPRGLTTNYTYDTFNRLFNIKNDDSKVLNQYKYHYYNQ